MKKTIPIMLWSLVVVFGAFTWLMYQKQKSAENRRNTVTLVQPESGAVYEQIPWKHFQDVLPFQLTNQNGEEFDSRTLAGRPYVVSFFFADCLTICKDLNRQIQSLRKQVGDKELVFISISVDPEKDTPDVLKRYARDFDADIDDWIFLTGEEYKIKEVGEWSFQVIVDTFTHTDNILLVDRWGRFRDRFKWDDPYDMQRFTESAKDVLAEQKPPLEQSFYTRNMMASVVPSDHKTIPWIRDFHLTDQNDKPFFSRDLTGQVWIANFFFTSCTGICIEQNEYLAGLQNRMGEHPAHIVSITTHPVVDTPQVLRDHANKIGADLDTWAFCTGELGLINRISGEMFKAHASEDHHSSRLFVVDRWGNVRGDFDWQEPGDEAAMFRLVDELNLETQPTIK